MNPTPDAAPSVTNLAFLSGLLPNLDPTETWWVCSYVADPNTEGADWFGGPATPSSGHFGRASANSFFAIATIKRREGSSRRKAFVSRVFAIPLDDVEGELPLPPTWAIQTSLHKQQAGYRLVEPLTDLAVADRLLQELVRSGRVTNVDRGGCNVARYVRLPVGCNTKAGHVADNGGKPFQHRLLTWRPEVAYTPAQLAAAFGLDLTVKVRPKSEPRPAASLDHALLLGLLHESGLYKRDLGDGRHEMTCPWVEEHTDKIDNGTAYFSPSEEYPDGGFRCLHGHCADRHLSALRRHLGPSVAWGVEETAGAAASGVPRANGAAHTALQTEAVAPAPQEEPEPTPPPDMDVEPAHPALVARPGPESLSIAAVLERERSRLESPIPRIATGWERLDKVLGGGLEVPSLTVLGAGPKSSKSTWAQMVAVRHVEEGGFAYVLDLENGARRALRRILCRRIQLGYSKVSRALEDERAGVFSSPDELSMWRAAQEWVTNELGPRYLVEHAPPDNFVARVQYAREQAGDRKLLVVVDSLQKLPGDPRDDRRNTIDKWMRLFEKVRFDCECALLAISEIKRGKEGYAAREDAFKESGGIEYAGDLLLTMNRPAADEEAEDPVSTLRVELSRDTEEDPRGAVASYRPLRPWYGLEEIDPVATSKKRHGRPPTALSGAVQFLRELLAEGAVSLEELRSRAGAAGVSEMTLKRARTELGVIPCTINLQAGVRLP